MQFTTQLILGCMVTLVNSCLRQLSILRNKCEGGVVCQQLGRGGFRDHELLAWDSFIYGDPCKGT